MTYVILRTDQGGGFVAPAGSRASYTPKLQEARAFVSREAAEREVCPGNEVVLTVEQAMQGSGR